jgi:hypothetical protein
VVRCTVLTAALSDAQTHLKIARAECSLPVPNLAFIDRDLDRCQSILDPFAQHLPSNIQEMLSSVR